MSVSVLLNGITYSIPEPGDTAWGQDLTDYLVAQASGLLQKAGGSFSLTAEVDFGATYGLKSVYFKSRATNPATAGQFRLGNAEVVSWRNAGNSSNLDLKVNSSNLLEFNGTAIQPIGNYITALTGDVAATGPGSVVATIQPGVIVNSMINASAAIAYSKLALTGSIVNADINASAAIAYSKLAALTASRALVSDGSGIVSAATTTATEIGYVNGVTSAIQTQLNGKQASGNYITALTGEVTASGPGSSAATVSNAAVIAKVLTGYASGAGTVSASDSILSAVQKLNGNDALKQPLATLTTKGDLYVATASATVARQGIGVNGQVLVSDSTQTNGLKWGNAPQGLKNYIVTNADLEQGSTTGFGLGTVTLTSNFPSGVPTFGSGASGNLSLSLVSSGQLAGSYSLGYVSSAATTAGNFVATDAFTVDLEGQAKVMQFSFFYQYQSGTINFSGTSSNSFGVAIYDVTNSQFIQPAGVFNLVQNSGVGKASGTFQTSSNGTSYRLVIYNANATGAGPMSIYLDDFFVGPQITAAGAAASDWQSYSMTITGSSSNPTKGTTTTDLAYWRRVGDSMEVTYTLVQSGAGSAGSGTYLFSLPSGAVIDSSKVVISTTSFRGHVGVCHISNSTGSSARFQGNSFAYDTTHIALGVTSGSVSDWNAVGSTNAPLSDSAQVITFRAVVPISGWSSNTVMSNDTDTRAVQATYNTGSTAAQSSGVPLALTFTNKISDTHAAYTTGSGTYTVPVSGTYRVSFVATIVAASAVAGNTPNIALQKNGTTVALARNQFAGGSNCCISLSYDVPCNAGDTLTTLLSPSFSAGSSAMSGTATECTLSIDRISGPATIAAAETVAARYTTGTGSFIGGVTQIQYTTKDYDSHNAVTTGASWKFTAPISGKYSVKTSISTAAVSWTAGNRCQVILYKNNSSFAQIGQEKAWGTITTGMYICCTDDIQLLAGDFIDLRLDSSQSGNFTTNADMHIAIVRVGN